MKALKIGATGATGKDLVEILLTDNDYTKIVLFVRRPIGFVHPKLVEVITDFDKLEEVYQSITGDVWSSCLGTTLEAAVSKDKQKQIDLEIPLKFAEIAEGHGIRAMVLLSATGASAKSKIFYSKLKGDLEDAIASLVFDSFVIYMCDGRLKIINVDFPFMARERKPD